MIKRRISDSKIDLYSRLMFWFILICIVVLFVEIINWNYPKYGLTLFGLCFAAGSLQQKEVSKWDKLTDVFVWCSLGLLAGFGMPMVVEIFM